MSLLSLYSQYRLSLVSVVFDFNASLNDVAPVSPMWLPVYAKKKEKRVLLTDVICMPFFCFHKSDRVQ